VLTPRIRVKKALNHEETDRPPADLGSTCNTSITRIAYMNLRAHLGYSDEYIPKYLSEDMQVVEVEKPIHEKFHIDTVGIHSNPPDVDRSRRFSEERFMDEWGIKYMAAKRDGEILYYDIEESPLAAAGTLSDIENRSWPDPDDPGRTRGLRKKAAALHESTDYALVGHMGDTSIFQACTLIRGMEQFLTDLVINKKLANALLERMLDIQSVKMKNFLEETGEFLDVLCIGDDFGGQSGLLVSPLMFKQMIKPYIKSYLEIVKSGTDAKINLHSCGAIQDILPDLIEIGVDIINPVQVSAAGMDPAALKKRFGKDLSFWGGIDTQNILPSRSPAEVAEEARRIAGILGKGGGYVLNPVHNIQPDVPPENVVALYEAFL
jgi:uroporphyrinogen decarboxylase